MSFKVNENQSLDFFKNFFFQQKEALLAVRGSDLNRLEEALGQGAEVNEFEKPLLLEAVKFSNREIVLHLLQQGAWVNFTDYSGESALHFATQTGKQDVMNLLIDCDAVIDSQDRLGRTPLMNAVFHGNWNCLTRLVDRGANVLARSKDGVSVLDYATKGRFMLSCKKGSLLSMLKRQLETGTISESKWDSILSQDAKWTKSVDDKYRFIQTYLLHKAAIINGSAVAARNESLSKCTPGLTARRRDEIVRDEPYDVHG